ncbi:hypothetical protein EhV448 [Emiliania huxleyi virus 86]|uniref:mRNA 5'-phosphatase n=1 Tax=Emiliania huxleyi virus 86 (isolate United Kingdom/English Channel/1999) TaxID=654925 RepID=Q4A231_EHV8U|nr:hypothetical protein EhV448 [Emiliania huxleyi virus 86]AHA55073.1 hypothetical protein EhV145_00524 [Emiliania huxleyi virus 145]AHA56077.1 hypothetical protein EhV164_00490 [Emiliania huxleyi virus 164]UKZ11476.1 hypothetical protein EhVM1_000461 [Emiliania huxleyi virus M1]CAZ69778.1 putative mRNA capping enzyme [Emiliania huxleyi virus 99B1]CAI65875.1 hypothetical protein EhV448 [Emiliania huxleyi virus 86]|mmetsp:Transcript_22810/g.65122  ORF Transcript_22810/g.65122 Transcript_22810/m.65122 type:complete len:231 (+) Transcript_22810:2044-2736(+)
MYIKKVTALLDEAKKLHKQDIPVEIEVRIGSIENGTFKAGVPRGRYNMMMDWFQQSNLTTTGNWTTSIAHFTGKHERCIITKDTPGSVKNIELVEKKPVGSIILSSNHPEGIALRFCVYTEKPLPNKGTVTTGGMVRYRQRKSYSIDSKGYENTFSFDFTQVWQGTSERNAKELHRHSKDTRFEIELELTNNTYLEDMSSNYLADSIIGKCVSLFQHEMEVGRDFDLTVV